MSMDDHEWEMVSNALRALPAQDRWNATTDETYRTMLAGLSHEEAMRALAAYAMTGGTFRPTWAELLRIAAGTDNAVQSFVAPEDAWRLVERAIGRVKGGLGDQKFGERHQAAIDWLRSQDEAVAAWAASRGLRGRGSLGNEDVHHPQFGGAVLKRLAGDYGDVRSRAVERVQLGKPAFEDRAFLVRGTGEGGGGMAELLERLRPVRELEAGDGPPSAEAVAFLRRMNDVESDAA
jgi:hypothetical protein